MNPEETIQEETTAETTTVTTTSTEETAAPKTIAVEVSSFTGDTASGKLILEETAAGINVTVQDVTPMADIRGVFFNLADDSLLSGLQISGSNVTNSAFGLSGSISQDATVTPRSFEGNVEIGTSGIGADDINTTSFTLSHESETLTLDQFLGHKVWDYASPAWEPTIAKAAANSKVSHPPQ